MKKVKRNHQYSAARRRMLGLSVLGLPLLGGFGGLGLSSLARASLGGGVQGDVDTSGFKAMVGVFLHGGNDAYNTLVPKGDLRYQEYASVRGNLAIPENELFEIMDSKRRLLYGLHPGMEAMQGIYNGGDLTFVTNVGPLVEPVTRKTFESGDAELPLGLYSHSDQQRHWQTAVPQSRLENTGWLGRLADFMGPLTNSNQLVPMSMAMNGLNIIQNGQQSGPYVVDGERGAIGINGYDVDLHLPQNRVLTQTTDEILDNVMRQNLLSETYAQYYKRSVEAAVSYQEATAPYAALIDNNPNINFPDTDFGLQLRQTAIAIAAHEELGMGRQLFVTQQGGFDHHSNLLGGQGALLPVVSQALDAFHTAMVELGLNDDVVLYTLSDFGRTLTSNGNGSDHAWGGHSMVMGGPVRGGRLYGDYPSLGNLKENPLEVGEGRGILIPTTASDLLHLELAMWFGLRFDNTMLNILPNVWKFHPEIDKPPLGMLNISDPNAS